MSDDPLRPYLRVANVFDGRIDVSDVLEMPFSSREFARFELRRGDVLLNEGQSLELVGRCAMYRGEYAAPCAIQNALIRFRGGAAISAEYAEQLFRWLQRSGVFAEIATQTTSIAHLGVKRFADLEVVVPPIGEQKRIAAILASMDEAIEATHVIIGQLHVAKRAMMAELLTRGLPGRHTRFKQTEIGGVPEGWDVVQLGGLLASGPDNGLYKPQSDYGDGVPIVRIDAFGNGEVLDCDGLRLVRATASEVVRFQLRRGDILLNRVNSLSHLAKTTLVPQLERATIFESNMMRITVDERRALPSFVFRMVASPRAKDFFLARAKQAVAQASVNQQDVRALLIALPPLSEQAAITDLFDNLDTRIRVENAYCSELVRVKATLTSVLLTGEVRVNPDPEAA